MPHKPDPFRSAVSIAFSMRNGKGLVCATIAFLTLVLRRKLSAFVKLFLPPLPFLTLLRMSIKCKQLCMNEKKKLTIRSVNAQPVGNIQLLPDAVRMHGHTQSAEECRSNDIISLLLSS